MTPKLNIHLRDGFAEAYAFATLFNYMVENGFRERVTVVCDNIEQSGVFSRRIEKIPLGIDSVKFIHRSDYSDYKKADIHLGGYSDVSGSDLSNIEIDLSVLKNCVEPLSESERNQLREANGISLEKKVLVIGCPSGSGNVNFESDLIKLTKALSSETEIYLVGTIDQGLSEKLSPIKKVETRGVLREYYAMADVTSINCNLRREGYYLHNFIEATEGGPLFLVPPEAHYKTQFGYKELVDKGVIRELECLDHLICKVSEHLNSSQGEKLRELRREHLTHCRKTYLKDLHSLINKLLGKEHAPFESDLEIESGSSFYQSNILRLIHPQTNWSQINTHQYNVPLKDFSDKPLRVEEYR